MNDIEEQKTKDLSPILIAQMTKPHKTWFIERTEDKFIFACEETEAWKTLRNGSNWVRHDFKIIGVSDGTTYANVVNSSKGKSVELRKKIQEVEDEANKYRKTEERFVFDELLEKSDPKVLKVREIINGYDIKLNELNSEYMSLTKNIAKTAFEAELKVAIDSGNREFPKNRDIITPGANDDTRAKIMKNLPA